MTRSFVDDLFDGSKFAVDGEDAVAEISRRRYENDSQEFDPFRGRGFLL